MAELVKYSKEFLPHIIRLFAPDTQRAEARINWFRQQFAVRTPDPEESCWLVKGEGKLLACAHVYTLGEVRPGLVFVNLAVDGDLSLEMWHHLWDKCLQTAKQLTPQPVLRTLFAAEQHVPRFLQDAGFSLVREIVELQAPLGKLPPAQGGDDDSFTVASLAERPDLEDKWLEAFNQGLGVFWDMAPLDSRKLSRLIGNGGLEPKALRIGLAGSEPVAALYYEVVDVQLGIARIHAAATPFAKRSKGYGRRMLKDVLNHLEEEGFTAALLAADANNQATHLLFKMLGFVPVRKLVLLEAKTVSRPEPGAETIDAKPQQVGHSFYPGLQVAIAGEKQ